jgi:hypothetical protein
MRKTIHFMRKTIHFMRKTIHFMRKREPDCTLMGRNAASLIMESVSDKGEENVG